MLCLRELLGGGGSACDPRPQAVHRPEPGEEAGGIRARAQPAQDLAFLLVRSAHLTTSDLTYLPIRRPHKVHVMCVHHVHVHAFRHGPALLLCAKVKE